MYSLAAQELARHRAAHGKTAEAVKVLEQALAEMPGEDQAAGAAAEEADHHPGDLYRVDLGQREAQ